MSDLNQTFAEPDDFEAAVLRNVDMLVDLGLDRAKVEPICRAAIQGLELFYDIIQDCGKNGLKGHDATLAKTLLVGGIINWCEDKRLACELALHVYVSKYSNRGA